MMLYIISVGLSVTMGLMGFVNLAHGVFAMAGGYVTVTLMNRYGVPFGLALPAAFVVVAPQRRPRAALLRTFLRRRASSSRCCLPSGSYSCQWRSSAIFGARVPLPVSLPAAA